MILDQWSPHSARRLLMKKNMVVDLQKISHNNLRWYARRCWIYSLVVEEVNPRDDDCPPVRCCVDRFCWFVARNLLRGESWIVRINRKDRINCIRKINDLPEKTESGDNDRFLIAFSRRYGAAWKDRRKSTSRHLEEDQLRVENAFVGAWTVWSIRLDIPSISDSISSSMLSKKQIELVHRRTIHCNHTNCRSHLSIPLFDTGCFWS